MRTFIILCLVATACAQYNYQQGLNSGNGGGPNYGSGSSVSPSYGGSPSNGGSPSHGGGPGSASNDDPAYAPQGELEKEFYTFTADEDDFVQPAASNQYEDSAKRGLRVIFIKGPENNGLEDAALALAKQAAEQRTAIYVLNKQHDLGDFANKLKQVGDNVNNKPEVHFVKYRTPEDAANAQRAIQGEYDNLGGPSQHFNGGVAPALNFASQSPVAPRGSHGAGSSPSGQYLAPSGGGQGPRTSYLPASILRRFRR